MIGGYNPSFSYLFDQITGAGCLMLYIIIDDSISKSFFIELRNERWTYY